MKLWDVTNIVARYRISAADRRIEVSGRLWLHGGGRVAVGEATRFSGGASGIELFAMADGFIIIGAGCYFAEGVSIEATRSVTIGDRVRLGAFTKILDNNFHPLRGSRHTRTAPSPVVIEDDVQIGSRVIVLPGVVIERGALIQPGAVVTRRVPAGAEVAGNPARRVQS